MARNTRLGPQQPASLIASFRRLDRRRKAIGLVVVAVAVLGVGGVVATSVMDTAKPGTPGPVVPFVGAAGSTPAPSPPGASASGGGPGTDPSASGGTPGTGPPASGGASGVDPSAPTAAPPPDQAGAPAALVNPFAGGPGGTPRATGTGPTTVTMAPGIDGCDHDYGDAGQCIPWTFPAGTADRCKWLEEHGFKPGTIKVRGGDRHDLEKNGDGIACGPGDE